MKKLQKLYRNGNSVAVTIPKDYLEALNLNEDSEVYVVNDEIPGGIVIYATPAPEKKSTSSITPEFYNWLASFNKKYGPALRKLAKR